MKNICKATIVVVILIITVADLKAEQILYGHQDFLQGVYRIDDYATTPTAVFLEDTGVGLTDIAVDPTTGLMYGSGARLEPSDLGIYQIDPIGGAAPVEIVLISEALINALEFDNEGNLWAWGNTRLYKVDVDAKTSDFIGDVGYSSDGDLAFDADGTLYGLADDLVESFNTDLITINTETGQGTLVGPTGIGALFGLEIDVDQTMYAASQGGVLYTLDKTNGTPTTVDTMTSQFGTPRNGGLTFTLPAIPEPTTAVLLATISFIYIARRHRV